MAWEMYQLTGPKMFDGTIDWDTDTIKMALLVAHTADTALDDFWDDVSADEMSGTGYTAGGETLTCSVVRTAANSWGTNWAASTAYNVGDIVKPVSGNGFVYRAVVAGTSAASEPTWPTTPGVTVVDNGVTWANIGQAVIALDATDPTWTGLDAGTPSHAVVWKDTGTPATSPLIAINDAITTPSNGADYTVNIDDAGIIASGIMS